MRDLLQRLERLETAAAAKVPAEPLRIIRRIIGVAPGGGPAPFEPEWATARNDRSAAIQREAGESVEAFEARALERFGGSIIVGSRTSFFTRQVK